MNVVVIVLLGLLWASILVPGLFRDRRQRSPQGSIDAFERSMGILANDLRLAAGGSASEPESGRRGLAVDDPERLARRMARMRTLRRRRQVLQALVTATLLSGIAVAVAGPLALPALGVSAAALAAYVGLLLHFRSREGLARRTVRRLPQLGDGAGPQRGDELARTRRVSSGGAAWDSPV